MKAGARFKGFFNDW